MKIVILFTLLLLFQQYNGQEQQFCRALCLEGGGDAGAYEAGALYSLVNLLPAEDTQYDVVTGVSTGALGGLVISSFPKGKEKEMIEAFKDFYFSISNSDIFVHWNKLGKLSDVKAFSSKPSLLDSTPLKKTLERAFKQFGSKIHRKYSIGVTDATNGRKIVFDADKMKNEDVINAAYSSASMPFFFQYQNFQNKYILVDGGVLHNLDVSSAIRRCKEMGFQEEQIIIDVILSHGNFLEELPYSDKYTGYQMLKRYLQMNKFKKGMPDLLQSIFNFPQIKFRNIIIPLEDIGMTDIPLDFSQKLLRSMFNYGVEDAKKILTNPDLISIHKLKQYVDKINNPEEVILTSFPTSNLRTFEDEQEDSDEDEFLESIQ